MFTSSPNLLQKYNLSKIHNLSNIKNDYKLYKNLVEVNASIVLVGIVPSKTTSSFNEKPVTLASVI